MGSRRFFFFFPSPGGRLDFVTAIHAIASEGLEFETSAYVWEYDPEGIPTTIHERHLRKPTAQEVCSVLAADAVLEIECHDSSLLMTCSFGSPHERRLCSMNVSRRLWFGLSENERAQYESRIARIARHSGAGAVLVLDDPADDFLGKIIAVDGQWLIDFGLADGSEYESATVWATEDMVPALGVRSLRPTPHVVEGFAVYDEGALRGLG